MCGRYTYFSSEELLKQFNFDKESTTQLGLALALHDNYNVSPGSDMPIIVRGHQAHKLEFMNWGLIPSWSKDPTKALKLINARAEGLLEKPMWKCLIKSKRCVVPARGFYEWRREGNQKLPYYITPKDDDYFSFAGLWDEWHDDKGNLLLSYTIITTEPNTEMKEIHNRMPAVLTKDTMNIWLSPIDLHEDELHDLLRAAPDDSLNITRVSTEVNNARHNSKDLIYPLED